MFFFFNLKSDMLGNKICKRCVEEDARFFERQKHYNKMVRPVEEAERQDRKR